MEVKQTTAEEAIRDYIQEARKQGVPEKKIRALFNKMNGRNKEVMSLVKKILLEERISQNKKNLEKLKGGFNKKMPKKEKKVVEEDDFDLEEEDDEEDDDEEDEEVEEVKPKKSKRVKKEKINPAWFVSVEPERLRVLDPVKKTIIMEANNATELGLQLQVKILQLLEEKL